MTRVQETVLKLKAKHGSWRKLQKATGINYNYLFRLSTGEKVNPSDTVLAILGLERRETYVRKGNGNG